MLGGRRAEPNAWQRVSVRFVATSTLQSRIHLTTQGTTSGDTVFWDQVQIVRDLQEDYGAVEKLGDGVAALMSDFAAVRIQMEALRNKIDTLEAQNASVWMQMEGLQSKVDTLEAGACAHSVLGTGDDENVCVVSVKPSLTTVRRLRLEV